MFHRRTGMQVAALRFCWVSRMEEARAAAAALRNDPGKNNQWRLFWSYVDVRVAASAGRE